MSNLITIGACVACANPIAIRKLPRISCVGVCPGCRAILVFENGTLRNPSDKELMYTLRDKTIQGYMRHIAERHAAGVFQ